VYLALLLVVVSWDHLRRRWPPTHTLKTEHYVIYSTATAEQTQRVGEVCEMLYEAYADTFGDAIDLKTDHHRLRTKLYRDREEFRRCNRVLNWAEAFYRPPYTYQYCSADEANPYHWMSHEATHQLNAEVARLRLAKWLNEGIAGYFSTSRIIDDKFCLGVVDNNTYPVWWLSILATSGDLASDIENGSVIPLRAIVTGRGGPSMNKHFNLYYLHWWTLTHFLFHYEGGKYCEASPLLAKEGGSLAAFEKHIGRVDAVQTQWYGYVQEHRRSWQTGQRSHPSSSAGPAAREEQAVAN